MQAVRRDAREIADHILERTGIAMSRGDFKAFLKYFALPHVLETYEERRVVEDTAQMRTIFEAVRKYHAKMHASEVVRHCIEAEYRDDNTIETTHEARVVKDNQLVQRPYPVFSVLRRINGVWMVTSSQYAIVDAPELNKALLAEVVSS